jgi:hypothetical protein
MVFVFYFKKIDPKLSLIDLINLLENSHYSAERGEGFIIDEVNENNLYAKFIFQINTTTTYFDETDLIIKKSNIQKKAIIDFSYNSNCSLLTILSNLQMSIQLITEIGKLWDFKITISNINITPETLLKKFYKLDGFNLQSIKVQNFRVSKDMIGDIKLKSPKKHIIKELLLEYKNDISYFGFSFELNSQKKTLGCYENGNFIVYNNKNEDTYELINKIQNILIE